MGSSPAKRAILFLTLSPYFKLYIYVRGMSYLCQVEDMGNLYKIDILSMVR